MWAKPTFQADASTRVLGEGHYPASADRKTGFDTPDDRTAFDVKGRQLLHCGRKGPRARALRPPRPRNIRTCQDTWSPAARPRPGWAKERVFSDARIEADYPLAPPVRDRVSGTKATPRTSVRRKSPPGSFSTTISS